MAWIFFAALLLRLALAFLPGFPADSLTFTVWSRALVVQGSAHFYGTLWCDYPPGYLYALWLVGLVYHLIDPALGGGSCYAYLVKLPPILADLGLGWLIFAWARELCGRRRACVLASLWLFNPAVWIDSAVWGQADSVLMFWLMSAVYLLVSSKEESAGTTGLFLALAFLTKPQALLLFPLIAVWVWIRFPARRQIRLAAAFLGGVVILALPFWGERSWRWLFDVYRSTAQQYRYTSVNAFNFWAIFGMWRPDDGRFLFASYFQWGLMLFGAAYAWVLRALARDPSREQFMKSGFLVALGGFLFLTRMHERYAFTALPFLILTAAQSRGEFAAACGRYGWLSAAMTANLLYALYVYDSPAWVPSWTQILGKDWVVRGVALANVGLWAAAATRPLPAFTTRRLFARLRLLAARQRVIAFAFFAAALILYAFRLGVPGVECYDEVHHVQTARQFLALREPTEWTHPHFGKLAMALSLSLLGDNAWAWRLPQAVAGAGTVAVVYLLGASLFSSTAGFLSALLLLCDGLQFTLSRAGMLEAHAVFFILLSYLILCRWFFMTWRPSELAWLGLGLSLGLAFASKWTAFFAYGGVLTLLAAARQRGREASPPMVLALRATAFLFFLPLAVYLLSFFRYVQAGHSLGDVLAYQKTMWSYHARIVQTHAYASPWWSWPLMLRPVWTYFSAAGDGKVQGILFLGNPAVFWAGLPCLGYVAWRAVHFKEKACAFLLAAFCFQYLPWGIQPRKLVFFHHFYTALPFLCLAVGYALSRLLRCEGGRRLTLAYLVLVILLFAYFYPLLSAWPIGRPSYMVRMWFRSWI